MNNKYLYTFLKDKHLQWPVVLTTIAAILCLVVWQMAKEQKKELSVLQSKKQVIAEIPGLQDKLARLESSEGLLLTGIIFNKERPLAAINDKVMAVGEVIDNKKLRAIWVDRVTVCDNVLDGKCVDLELEE